MARTGADLVIETLQAAGVKRIYGVAGDSLNGLTDSLRRTKTIEWVHIRHEEAGAFAAGAEAHLTGLRELRVRDQPRELLSSVEGLSVNELTDRDVCCGFGGLFSIKYPAISERMADDKIADATATGADMLIGGDLGCLLHLEGRMQRQGKAMRVRNVAEVLADEP